MSAQSDLKAITARGLCKRFGAVQAVDGADIEVDRGEALGLLGPNGAGKSTVLSILMGLIRADAGQVSVFGHPAGSPQARALCGATPQIMDFPDQLTPRELLAYTAARYGRGPEWHEPVCRFDLGRLMDRRVSGFSGGEKRRVALALAFAGDPKLVFLDEPTAGLDAEAQERFRQVARDYIAQGGAIVLTSHHWDEIEAVCSTLAFIDRGATVLDGQVADMRSRARTMRVTFALPTGTRAPEWMRADHDGALWSATCDQSDTFLRRMVRDNLPFEDLTIEPLKLKELIDRIRRQESGE